MKRSIFIIPLIILFVFAAEIYAQKPVKARPSPLEMVTMKYEDTYVKITYGRPHMRDREIFGELVPYGQVWRTGANEATEITTSGDIVIAGNELPAGTYTIFTIPEAEKWTVILNRDLGQWGAYKYQEELDVMRFDVPVEQITEIYEPFTIEFEQKNNGADIAMMWDQTRVVIPIEFKH